MEECRECLVPGEVLPIEIWELIFLNLDRRGLARISIVCLAFHATVKHNKELQHIMHRYRFDKESSRDVMITGAELNVAKLGTNLYADGSWVYPEITKHVAYVASNNYSQKELVHLKVTNPGYFFCICVHDVLPAQIKESQDTSIRDRWKKFGCSYYPDGDAHTYGAHAHYPLATRGPARYTTGDIISVEIGTLCPAKPSAPLHEGFIDCPFPPREFFLAARQEQKEEQKKEEQKEEEEKLRKKGACYCIFFKNGQMVHAPFILSSAKWPLYISIYFTNSKEMVEIIDDYKVQLLTSPDTAQPEERTEATTTEVQLQETIEPAVQEVQKDFPV